MFEVCTECALTVTNGIKHARYIIDETLEERLSLIRRSLELDAKSLLTFSLSSIGVGKSSYVVYRERCSYNQFC